MKTIERKITFSECSFSELQSAIQSLIQSAKQVSAKSYAPYSQFHVGAAVLLANGTVVLGSNQENGAYPSGLCAERTALFSAGANYPDVSVRALAIAAQTKGAFLPEPITPCGACAQVISECELRAGQPIQIYLYGTQKVWCLSGVQSLLPFSFKL